MPKRVPIKVAYSAAKTSGCRQVIFLGWDGERTHIVTYGETVEDCAQAAQGGNLLKEKWGWPECNDQPSRVKKLEAQLRQREAELEQRWIAVGERLPDVGRRVCVSVSHPGYKTRTMGLWTGESWKIASLEKEQGQLAATIEGTITHWQRIPAPPK